MRGKDTLASGFLRSAALFPSRPAVEVGGRVLTYSQLSSLASAIAATLLAESPKGVPPLTAVFAYRSVVAFSGVLAALLRGYGYVPLNRTFPLERTKAILQRSRCNSIIVDAQSQPQLDTVLEDLDRQMLIILPERSEVSDLRRRWPQHRFVPGPQLCSPAPFQAVAASPDSVAYLLFTSGSTGMPKGVMVAHRNVRAYVDFIVRRFNITEQDRFSQMFDMTFDLSVADMFVAWERGACVCCPTEKALINPGQFIRDADLTVWFSVPSTAVFMKKLGTLKPSSYPRLRLSMFCGEALPVEIAKAWAEAAPNSIIENLYGPTELTVACMAYKWAGVESEQDAELGLVPIGESFPGMEALVVDGSLKEVEVGEDGELLMTGPQMSLGYWDDPEKTAASFLTPPGKNRVYYRTGDRVRKPLPSKPMVYLGRVDNQIKILGHRVELGEVEAVVREESGIDVTVAVGWPKTASGASGIEVFLQAESIDMAALKNRLALRLPSSMVPRRIHVLREMPLNSNGKYDRKALLTKLEGRL